MNDNVTWKGPAPLPPAPTVFPLTRASPLTGTPRNKRTLYLLSGERAENQSQNNQS